MSRTRAAEVFYALSSEFEAWELKSYESQGRTIHYVSRATITNRLDTVLGPENWEPIFSRRRGGVYCELRMKIQLADGELLEFTKRDFGGFRRAKADSKDPQEESRRIEGGYTKAFKRACEQVGIARYLKRDGIPAYFDGAEAERYPSPSLPPPNTDRQRPRGDAQGRGGEYPVQDRPARDAGNQGRSRPAQDTDRGQGNAPRNGRQLFAWSKDQGQRHQIDILKYLNAWAKQHDITGRMVDWGGDVVAQAYVVATERIRRADVENQPDEEPIVY